MENVVGVRFKEVGKIYYFSPDTLEIKVGDNVIVETSRGFEYGNVVIANREIDANELTSPLKNIIRVATENDDKQHASNLEREIQSRDIFIEKVAANNLTMKLIDVELTFDVNKIIFYFTADGRIDFRELVKDLAAVLRMRIELRQIGVRDEAKILNGIGICGRCLCCATFLGEFQPVSIKMAKDQNLSLNPTKISGVCGRLMCCLKYEEEAYERAYEGMPHEGATVNTPIGKGTVINTYVLKQQIRVSVNTPDKDIPTIETFNISDIQIMNNKKSRPNCGNSSCPHANKSYDEERESAELENLDRKEMGIDKQEKNNYNKKYNDKKKSDNKNFDKKNFEKKNFEKKNFDKKNFDKKNFDKKDVNKKDVNKKDFDKKNFENKDFDKKKSNPNKNKNRNNSNKYKIEEGKEIIND